MLATLLVLSPFAIALAALALAAHAASRHGRVSTMPERAAAPPRAGATRGPARPEIQPCDERQPFEAGNGLIIGEAVRP